ncbi:acyltransferase family protein [Pseudoalteromonas sp. NZS11]|uniref:acyltransferase family protein n=1 Tax=Pseudoalteromonas sp. NZS11 TaxID=2792049 RepID=UPI0018CF3243|nr:acyltransferase [Pseudoalteromonas sp. NZS11]MBH0080817.1 acyltransferase [Pseudoalteromonas sp. NZS11]
MKKRFEALDAFRGLCAMSVVLYHMHVVGSITELKFFQGSGVFVEFFFILSGFVLAHGYGFKESLNFKSYCKARFFRIYPLHFFMLMVFIAFELMKLLATNFGVSFNGEPFSDKTAVSAIIPNLLLIQSWTSYTEHLSFNFPSWSISIEFYIYFLFFFTATLFGKFKLLTWLTTSLLAFALIYFRSELLTKQVLSGLSCFFGGAIAYSVYRKISHIKIPYISGSIFEFALLVCIVFIVQAQFELKLIVAPLLFLITVLLFSFEAGVVSKILKIKPLQLTGQLSYSIYMTHAAILFLVAATTLVFKKLTGIEIVKTINSLKYIDSGSAYINNLIVLIILAVVIITSKFTYKYIELWGLNLNKKHKS